MTITPEEALEIARFLWPEANGMRWYCACGYIWRDQRGSNNPDQPIESWEFVHAAELAVIEGGYREAYANALAYEVLCGNVGTRNEYVLLGALAPRDARLRALLRVARQQQTKETE